MKHLLRIFAFAFLLVMGLIYFSGCANISEEVDQKLRELSDKANQLDSLVNYEIGKVKSLDSVINLEKNKIDNLDSLINTSVNKLDSIATDKMKSLQELNK